MDSLVVPKLFCHSNVGGQIGSPFATGLVSEIPSNMQPIKTRQPQDRHHSVLPCNPGPPRFRLKRRSPQPEVGIETSRAMQTTRADIQKISHFGASRCAGRASPRDHGSQLLQTYSKTPTTHTVTVMGLFIVRFTGVCVASVVFGIPATSIPCPSWCNAPCPKPPLITG